MPMFDLDEPTAQRVSTFCQVTGLSPEFFLSKIANDWLNEKGEDFIAFHGRQEQRRAKTTVRQTSTLSNVASINSSARFKPANEPVLLEKKSVGM
jgi:hypothetical protein